MNKKIIVFLGVIILLALFIFSPVTSSESTEGDDYDTAYYVEGNGNLFIKTAKMLDKCCFYVVDIVVTGIGSVFNSILGG